MNSVPEGVVQHILSQMNNARDIASCACVSKRWKDSIPFLPSLYFPRGVFDGLPRVDADAAISHMVSSALRLEELIIYCPFSASLLASWLSLRSHSLRRLELRMDCTAEKPAPCRLDAIGSAKNLEDLKLWGVSLTKSPNWGVLQRLRVLEIVGAAVRDTAIKDVVQACPKLVELALLGCDGCSSVSIELDCLEKCRLDFLGSANCSVHLSSPKLMILELQGFSWIHVNERHSLRRLSIAKTSGSVYKVDVGKLPDLEYLSIRGVQWSWNAISSVLQSGSEVKHLLMKIEFTGDLDTLQPFPQIDLVDFFNNHQKLCKFEIHGAMFAALCQKNSLKNLDSRFSIPCLEEVLVMVRSPLNPMQKLNTLESLVKYSVNLQKLVIRISKMRNCHETADEFFKQICKFKHMNHNIVHIE
ncbi:F-box domain-containing protein [Dioscorea alata]|uniref:F-box domain-containing protein n=1 Tax=Dioscorea alata TaxID=55571 RepID=A0ACB7VW84_DIOAL|nr:F-box domain-containing protein [Dioscorea alata]